MIYYAKKLMFLKTALESGRLMMILPDKHRSVVFVCKTGKAAGRRRGVAPNMLEGTEWVLEKI